MTKNFTHRPPKPGYAPLGLPKLSAKKTEKRTSPSGGAGRKQPSNTVTYTLKSAAAAGLDDFEDMPGKAVHLPGLSTAATLQIEDEFTLDDVSVSAVGRKNGQATDHDAIKHLAECLGIDTLGLEFEDVPERFAGLAKRFSENVDEQVVLGTGFGKASMLTPAGKRSLDVTYTPATKKFRIEGSNAMLRQGHNVVASADLTMCAYSMVRGVKQSQGLRWSDRIGLQVAQGSRVQVTRIDVFLLLRVPEGVSKAAFINALAIAGIREGLNTSVYVNESVYFDQSSQLESMKAYRKELEVKRARKGGLPDKPGVNELEALMARTIRVEFVYRAKWLASFAKKLGAKDRVHPNLFTKEVLGGMVLKSLRKHAFEGTVVQRMNSAELKAIPLPYRSTATHWQNGVLLQDMVKSERVLKQHRNFLWREHGINIDAPPPEKMQDHKPLTEIFSWQNFEPVPNSIRGNSKLFYEDDMDRRRQELEARVR